MKIHFRFISVPVAVLTFISIVNYSCADKHSYPPSPVIADLTWAPSASIIRLANGSDNWPITWADDDNLYTAYGDGWGFSPKSSKKLSLGIAKVQGTPPHFFGINIPSSPVEEGDGPSGMKASGMLMVENTLYMWVRNVNRKGEQSQLAFSYDYGKTWTWNKWKFEEFGYCTFINYSQNYDMARDNYVYTVTHDHPSAYKRADQFILMRVPKNRINNRNSYEFFQKYDSEGSPLWTSAISKRGAIFTDKYRCHRSGISYNAPLKRYIWWQAKYPENILSRRHTRVRFSIFDAPEPWGPWTLIYQTEQWDVETGETGSFPPKWMSEDGKTMYLVFSGNDSFSVRKATLTLLDYPKTTNH